MMNTSAWWHCLLHQLPWRSKKPNKFQPKILNYRPSRGALSRLTKIVALNQSHDDDEYVHIDGISCCTSCLEDQRNWTSFSQRSWITSRQEVPCWRKVEWCSKAVPANAQWVNIHWSCDFERSKNCDASSSTKESRQPGTPRAPRSCQDKGETQDESLVTGDGSACGKAVCGVLWVPTCDQTSSTPTHETYSYASAPMGRFVSGYITGGSDIVRVKWIY